MFHVAGEHALAEPLDFGDDQGAGDPVGQGSGFFGLSLHFVRGDPRVHLLPVPQPGHGDLFGAEAGGLAEELGRARAVAGVGEAVAGRDEDGHVGGHVFGHCGGETCVSLAWPHPCPPG